MAVWTARGGRHGEREERLLANGLIGGGWAELSSLKGIASKEDLAARYAEAYPDLGRQAQANYVGQLWSLLHRMQDGELVVMPLKTTGTIAVGRITGPYEFRDDLGPDLYHVRPVNWLQADVPRDAFDQDLLYSFGAYLTFGQVRRENAEERIVAAVERSAVPTQRPEPPPVDEGAGVEEAPDVEEVAREQIRQAISQRFAGHELAALVGAILSARGLSVSLSPPGADQGIDIRAGAGPMGLDSPRLLVQVKTGQAGIEEFRALRGLVSGHGADQGLLVAWGGFRGTVLTEAKREYFLIRLWDADALLGVLLETYDDLPDELRSALPLKRLWALVPPD
jgi:restriction system protein